MIRSSSLLHQLLFHQLPHLSARVEILPCAFGSLYEFGVIRVLLLLRWEYQLKLAHVFSLKLVPLLDLLLLHLLLLLNSRPRLSLDTSLLELNLLLLLVVMLLHE